MISKYMQIGKQKKKMLTGPEAKESPGFFGLVAFFRSPTICGTVVQFNHSNAETLSGLEVHHSFTCTRLSSWDQRQQETQTSSHDCHGFVAPDEKIRRQPCTSSIASSSSNVAVKVQLHKGKGTKSGRSRREFPYS